MNTFIRCAPRAGWGVVAVFAAALTLVSQVVHADQSGELETVVSATRTETPASHVGSSVTVISAEELRVNQYQWVFEALRQVPRVVVARSGSYRAVTPVFIRGSNSNHTLALVDGPEPAHPSSPT